ncbi:MAG: hypothetical protein J6I45_06260 [Clostridia bacterium]|nr:hypothetical protein [Clostridia bacterium]
MKNRIIASLLALLLAAGSLVSCESEAADDGSAVTTAGDTAAVETTAAEETQLRDKVPELNFNGADFSILMRTNMNHEFNATAENGEPVNDAVFRRNNKIAQRFNITFNMIEEEGTWATQSNFLGKIKNNVSAGDASYDLIAGYCAYISTLASDGYYYNWRDINYIDFTAPWWNQVLINETEINGQLHFMSGDLAISGIQNAICLFYNKNLWTNYQFEDPYELVRSGKWTIDKMQSFTTQAYQDLDGDGQYSDGDQYGYVTDTHNLVDAYQAALQAPALVRGDDGVPTLVIQEEKFLSAYAKIYDLLLGQKSTYTGFDQADTPENLYRPIFDQGRALIVPEWLGNAEILRSLEFDFGILPLPKYDEAQDGYHTISQDSFSLFCVPSVVKDIDMIGAVTEALACESRNSVIPAFYEVALKSKYARDEGSEEMIDLINNSLYYDFSTVHIVALNKPTHSWRLQLIAKSENLVSYIESQMKVYTKSLEKLLESYSDAE